MINDKYSQDGEHTMCIYKIQNMVNGKIYIGLTKNKAKYRWTGHIKGYNPLRPSLISLAIEKYGKENFDFSVIDIVENQDHLGSRESFWIKELNTISPLGYNLTTGGEFAKSVSDITRARQKVAAEARWDNPDDIFHTEEYRVKKLVILRNAKIRTDNTSGYKGVCWDNAKQKWKAQASLGGKTKNIGRYKTPEEASAAYQKFCQEQHGKIHHDTTKKSIP